MNERPNILYLMTDQQKASATSVYGNPFVPCPFMDRMAEQGLTFRDTYAPASICTPSRASVMTGVHPLVHQVTCHQNRAPYNLDQLPELLARSGYYTTVVGHHEYDRDLDRGWHHQTNMWTRGPIGTAAEFFYGQGRAGYGWASGPLECTAEEGHAHAVATRVINQLDSIQASGAPFFLHVPFLEPHPPFYCPPPYDTLVDPEGLPLPDRGDSANRPPWQDACRREQASHLATEADIRRLISIYYGMIAYANDQMQRIHDAMQQRGMLDNTWIIVASDHGDFLGEKGLFAKTESLYECLLHVPLIIAPPPSTGLARGKQNRGPRGLDRSLPNRASDCRCGCARIRARERPCQLGCRRSRGATARLPLLSGRRLPWSSGAEQLRRYQGGKTPWTRSGSTHWSVLVHP